MSSSENQKVGKNSNIISVNEICFFSIAYTHFQNFASFFPKLYTQIQELIYQPIKALKSVLHLCNKLILHCTHNMQHLLQNEALHSKYHKHISEAKMCLANTFAITLYFLDIHTQLFMSSCVHLCIRLKVIFREMLKKFTVNMKARSKLFFLL